MSNYTVISVKSISNSEALDIVSKKTDSDVELTYREEKTLNYLSKFKKLNTENFKKAKQEILALEIPRLEEEHIIKILDIMPVNGTELRSIVSTSGTVLVDESVKKIIDTLSKFR